MHLTRLRPDLWRGPITPYVRLKVLTLLRDATKGHIRLQLLEVLVGEVTDKLSECLLHTD